MVNMEVKCDYPCYYYLKSLSQMLSLVPYAVNNVRYYWFIYATPRYEICYLYWRFPFLGKKESLNNLVEKLLKFPFLFNLSKCEFILKRHINYIDVKVNLDDNAFALTPIIVFLNLKKKSKGFIKVK